MIPAGMRNWSSKLTTMLALLSMSIFLSLPWKTIYAPTPMNGPTVTPICPSEFWVYGPDWAVAFDAVISEGQGFGSVGALGRVVLERFPGRCHINVSEACDVGNQASFLA